MQMTFTMYNGETFFLFRVFVILLVPKQLYVHARNNRAQWKTIRLFLQIYVKPRDRKSRKKERKNE